MWLFLLVVVSTFLFMSSRRLQGSFEEKLKGILKGFQGAACGGLQGMNFVFLRF